MTQAQSAEEKARVKKQWTDLAIQQALSSQWEEAVITNKNILGMFPNEPEAYNRLGKAYSELGQYAESRQAYAQTLKYNPTNTIARKNLERLSLLQEEPVQVHAGVERIDPRLFIEETGKTGMTDLLNLGPSSVLAKVASTEEGPRLIKSVMPVLPVSSMKSRGSMRSTPAWTCTGSSWSNESRSRFFLAIVLVGLYFSVCA